MAPVESTIDPILSDGEREELRHLDYLSARLSEFRDRGLIAADSYDTIAAEGRLRREAIERRGRYQAAITRARAISSTKAETALGWARQARALDPDQLDAWVAEIDLLWQLGRDDEAVALCAEGAGRLPRLQDREAILRAHLPARAEARRERAERARREQEAEERLEQARGALRENRDADAVEIARAVLAELPVRGDALRILAHALHRLGRLEESLEAYQALAGLEPRDSTWPSMVVRLGRELAGRHTVGEPDGIGTIADVGPAKGAPTSAPTPAPEPAWSWSSFAAEFLEEHWQKLILCLAVLLIVVSSTVGAHLLLGDLLWRPAGKCALALVWTVAFAALGVGLIRWGAERAGQMMLVATLIVVPIHFMLAGEFRLVTEPTPSGLVVAALDGLALVALTRVVAGMLVPRASARFLTSALLLMSVGSVLTARGSPVPWGWQFAAFQAPAVVLLGAVGALGLRRWGETDADHRQFTVLALGLLGFAAIACVVRVGSYAMRLEPALYAGPVMVGAAALVALARRLTPDDLGARWIAGIRYAGYVLSALAFALTLSSRQSSALFSVNTIAVSLVGFLLYADTLRRERHPAFLYLSLAALVSARVGAHYFLAERIRLLIDMLRRALGYPGPLPWAYLALVGLAASPALVLLSEWFRRGWKDRRLAWHAHAIGLPLAVAACLWSCQEPRAAVIVLSGYTVLFGSAVWLYAEPRLTYPAILALCGASYFGSTLVTGITEADQALGAMAIAWAAVGVARLLVVLGAGDAFAIPWLRASRVLTPVALLLASGFIAVGTANSVPAAAVFLLGGLLSLLGTCERPRTLRAALVPLCFVELTICGLALLTGGRPHGPAEYALLLVGDGLVLLVFERLLGLVAGDAAAGGIGAIVPATAREVLGRVFVRSAIGLALIADPLALLDPSPARVGMIGLVWLMGASVMLAATRRVREVPLVHIGIAQFVAGSLKLAHWAVPLATAGLNFGWMAVAMAGVALVLWLVGTLASRLGVSRFYAEPCRLWALGLTAVVLGLAVESRVLDRGAYRYGAAALGLNALVTILLSRTWRRAELTYPAVLHVTVASYIVLFSTGTNDPRMAFVLGLAAVVQGLLWWAVGQCCERLGAGRARAYARPLYHATLALTMLGIVLCDRSSATLVLAGLAFLLSIRSLPRLEWAYAALGCLAAAVYFRWLAELPAAGLIASALGGSFVLWGLGVLVQARRGALCDRLGLRPLAYEVPAFHATIVMAAIAVGIRLWLGLEPGTDWTTFAWLPLGLALLSLLMVRAYPEVECVHLALGLLVYGEVAATYAGLGSISGIVPAVAGLAIVLNLAERAGRDREILICERLGIAGSGYLAVVRRWSGGLFAAASACAIAIVGLGVAASFGVAGLPVVDSASPWLDWWLTLAALGLAAGYLVLAASDRDAWLTEEPAGVLVGLHMVLVLGIWWLGAAGSPVAGWLPPASEYYPLATASVAIAAGYLARRLAAPDSWVEPGWLGEARSAEARDALAALACGLAVVASAFTGGAVAITTVATLALASVAIAMASVAGGWATAAGLGALSWAGAGSYLGLWGERRFGWLGLAPEAQAAGLAWGTVVAAFSLWWIAGRLRKVARDIGGDESEATLGARFARTVESVASLAGLLVSAVVLLADLPAEAPAAPPVLAGVGVLLASALLHVALVVRWRVEWPVYLAQVLMVGAYFVFRRAFPLASAADAAVLTLLGYLDMAIAEVLARFDRAGHFVRPTRYASLVMPLLPLLELVHAGWLDDVSLFYLAAAATFYATACGRLRWKWLGYAAAVFANAMLWLLWSRVGWRLAEYPQLYLVPVGFSAILFAEVNRELGRQAVNTIRSVGLVVIYASLALPIWQFASFGAWLTLLVASLVGIFLGIGLRLQTFLWLGLATFVLDVAYEMGRVSLEHATAKWLIMWAFGIALVLFVALNEKKRILGQMLDFYARARQWE